MHPSPRSLTAGVASALKGLRHAVSNRDVRRTYALLVLVTLVLGSLLQVLGVWGIWEWTRGTPDTGWLAVVALWILRLGGIAVVLLAAPLAAVFITAIFFPFLGERVFYSALRAIAPVRARELELRDGLPLGQSMGDAVLRLLTYLSLTVVVFAVGWIPLAGGIVAPALQALLTARMLGWELLDPYFDRLGYRYRDQRRYVNTNHACIVGFALPWSFVMAIPLLGPLVFGLAQAAAATLVADVLEGDLDST